MSACICKAQACWRRDHLRKSRIWSAGLSHCSLLTVQFVPSSWATSNLGLRRRSFSCSTMNADSRRNREDSPPVFSYMAHDDAWNFSCGGAYHETVSAAAAANASVPLFREVCVRRERSIHTLCKCFALFRRTFCPPVNSPI